MLTQAWVLPWQSMGRIKVIIAEGISHGPPGTTPFERKRNLVAFSFQHTPLCESSTIGSEQISSYLLVVDILEESGIAWPNPGMFYQMQLENVNPLSPRKDRDPDPDSHAHSPRRRVSAAGEQGLAKVNGMIPPPSFSYGMMQRGMMMPPPPFRVSGAQLGEPFPPPYNHHDPFSNISEHLHRRLSPQIYTRAIVKLW